MIVLGLEVANSFNFPVLKNSRVLRVFIPAPVMITVPPCDRIQDEKKNILPLLIDTLNLFDYGSLPCALNTQPCTNNRTV